MHGGKLLWNSSKHPIINTDPNKNSLFAAIFFDYSSLPISGFPHISLIIEKSGLVNPSPRKAIHINNDRSPPRYR